jgi:hypothetical protein
VEGVGADAEMETFLSGDFDEISKINSIQRSENGSISRLGIFCVCGFGGVTYLLAQIRAASRASELSCSYSLETMWTQQGKSSTLAFFRPRSKILILASGTPRLNRDLGYGYEGRNGR